MRIISPVAYCYRFAMRSLKNRQVCYWHKDRLAITYEIIYKARNHAVLGMATGYRTGKAFLSQETLLKIANSGRYLGRMARSDAGLPRRILRFT
jgi:hypothetical protein